MKKIILALILFCFVLAGIFAESEDKLFLAGFSVYRDMYYIRAFTGAFADDNDTAKKQDGNLYPYQGGPQTGIFQPSWFQDSALDTWIGVNYEGDSFGGYLKLMLYTPRLTSSYQPITDKIDVKSEWQGWARIGPWFDAVSLRFTFGNTEQVGQIPQYANHDDILQFRQGGMGVVVPINIIKDRFDRANLPQATRFPYGYEEQEAITGFAEFAYTGISDLFLPAGGKTNPFGGFLIEIETDPVTLAASVGGLFEQYLRPFSSSWESLWDRKDQLGEYRPDGSDDLLEDSYTNFGFRLESARIADLVSIAAIYKYGSMVRFKENSFKNPEINEIDLKRQNHEFGLYFNIRPVPEFGISAGYSGQTGKWTNKAENVLNITSMTMDVRDDELFKYWYAQYHKTELPFYNGIDLKVFYSGISNLGITFNNNVTFSAVKAYDSGGSDLFRSAWIYQGYLKDVRDSEERYFGLNSVLCLKYDMSDSLTADLQIANQLGIFTLAWPGGSASAITDNLGVYAGVIYRMWENEKFKAGVQCGLALALRSFQYQNVTDGKKYNAGYLDFGIPLGIKLEF